MKPIILAATIVLLAFNAWAGEEASNWPVGRTFENPVPAYDLEKLINDDNQTGFNESSFTIRTCWYELKPKEDITAYELALIIPLLTQSEYRSYSGLPANAKRHLIEHCTEYK